VLRTSMSRKLIPSTADTSAWKNQSARQRWELFHRAIAHAKQSNVAALDDADDGREPGKKAPPVLYVAK